MSIQGSKTDIKGKLIKGTGSILANLDASARRAFAKRANKADDIKQDKEQQLAFEKELEEIHQKVVERNKVKQAPDKPLSYWLFSANIKEIWQALFVQKLND